MLLLLQVALLIATAQADVKHVLEGSAQPPQHIHTYECQYPQIPYPGAPTPPNNAVPGTVDFWWSDANSPFRRAYEYFKKCSEKGNCLPPVAPGFQLPPGCAGCATASSSVVQLKDEYQKSTDFSKNPFLNGQVPVSGCIGNKCNNNGHQLDKNPFLNGDIQGIKQPTNGQGCTGFGCATSPPKPSYGSNPFLNGGACGNAGCINSINPEPPKKPDFSKNPFFTGGFGQGTFSGNGQAIATGSNGFLGVQPAIPFAKIDPTPGDNQIIPNAKPFPINYPDSVESPCNGPDQACVAPHLCINGFVNTDGRGIFDRRQSGENCEAENKVCCRVPEEKTNGNSGISLPSRSSTNTFPNILNIKNGKKSPGSVIKFNGGAGISPGSIQVISDNEVPSPHVSNSGESGSGIVQSATSDAPVFANTPDFSNDALNQISFISTTRGPQYLPPDDSPKPNVVIPELVAPSISTYEPIIPTTPRPLRPKLPFIPSLPQPFVPIIPQYAPEPEVEVLPELPSSPKPFVPQPPVIIPYPSPPIIQEPPIPQEPFILPSPPPFIRPEPEVTHIELPSIPLITVENRVRPTEPPPIPFFPKETPGYKYPTPSPPFSYPSPSTPKPLFSINDNFIPIKTRPTPKPYRPPPTAGYEYKKPTPSFPLPTTKPPFIPQPQPSGGYEYKKPTPSFPTPPPIKITNNEYLPPVEPQPSEAFEFKKTTPRLPIPPTIKVTNNQYLPPFEQQQPNRIPDGSNTNEFFISKPPVKSSTSSPTHEGQPDVPVPQVVGFPQPQQPSPPQAGCAAALKCVQEIYCTAEGVISPVPVILSKAQQILRVPTTECVDREAGIVGRCCRDPNYVDPWPSSNSLNGFDDGQYKEDPNLGKYFPDQRPQFSQVRRNVVKAPIIARSNNVFVNSETVKNNTCGVRHFNSQPRGPGPIDAAFGEIPWQAMILRDTTRKLLCGGVIVKANVVLTSAQCLDGLPTNDILIKGGEWKLGIDEEPLPFQIVRVSAIIRHPSYKPGLLQNDLALLILEENLRFAKNIAPICLSNNVQLHKQQCIATGWGKRILQVHLKGAIMRAIDVNILDNKQCSEVIQDRYKNSIPNYFANTICGFSKHDQCDIDYGSALACSSGNGIYTLAGIFSWDTGCKDDGQIGGYIPADAEWIEDTCSKPLTQLKAIDKKYNSQY